MHNEEINIELVHFTIRLWKDSAHSFSLYRAIHELNGITQWIDLPPVKIANLNDLILYLEDYYLIPDTLKGKDKHAKVAWARMQYYFLAKQLFPYYSNDHIGEVVGKVHSTVTLAIKKVKGLLLYDKPIQLEVCKHLARLIVI